MTNETNTTIATGGFAQYSIRSVATSNIKLVPTQALEIIMDRCKLLNFKDMNWAQREICWIAYKRCNGELILRGVKRHD